MWVLCIHDFNTQRNTSLQTCIHTYVMAECLFSNLLLRYFKHIHILFYCFTTQQFQIKSLRLHYATEHTSIVTNPENGYVIATLLKLYVLNNILLL